MKIGVFVVLLLVQYSNTQLTSLTLDNFKEHFGCDAYSIQGSPDCYNMQWFVMFMAPWCGHCQKAKPQFQAFDQHLKQGNLVNIVNSMRKSEGVSSLQGEGIKALGVDCVQEKELCRQFGVRGYPTLIYITSEKRAIKYKGKRTAQSFTNFTLFHDPEKYSFGEYVSIANNFWGDLANELSSYIQLYWPWVIIFGVVAPSLVGYFVGNLLFNKNSAKHSKKQKKQSQTGSAASTQPNASKKKE